MEQHHEESIAKFVALYQAKAEVEGLILGGSLAHGFAGPGSDIDIMVVVGEGEYEKRRLAGQLAFSLWDLCTYEGGYVDCKVVSAASMDRVARRGSDPARYAFQDASVLHSRLPGLPALLASIPVFPRDQKDDRRRRFAAQLLAWKWYFSQSVEKANRYLEVLAVQKLVLFACRLVLNENELLYPYHKWLLKVIEGAPRKPRGFARHLEGLLKAPDQGRADALAAELLAFAGLTEKALDWPNVFLKDSELSWVDHEAPVDDL